MNRHRLICALVLVAASGCDTPSTTDDTGTPVDGGGGGEIDTGGVVVDAGGGGVDAPPMSDAGPAADFDTPVGEWTYVEIPGGACGNGSPYGVAINRSASSDRLLVFMQGGGACWDNLTCNVIPFASHTGEDVSSATVIGEATSLEPYLFSRDGDVNPFADTTFVYLPYCTGDVHVGDSINEYTGGTIHHVGYRNVTGVLNGLRGIAAATDHVWLTGASAGGYGTLVNWYRFREAFPTARVDALDDSGPPVDISPDRWTAMMAAWSVPAPTGCPDCLDGLGNVTEFYQREVTDGDRYALLQYTQDSTIRQYTGLSGTGLETAVRALAPAYAATSSHRVFILAGDSHVVLGNPSRTSGGVVASDWVRAFATDGAGWVNVVP
jgi:hypothetical protein